MEEPKFVLNEEDIFNALPGLEGMAKYHQGYYLSRCIRDCVYGTDLEQKLSSFRTCLKDWFSEHYPHNPNPVFQKRVRESIIFLLVYQLKLSRPYWVEADGLREEFNPKISFSEFYSNLVLTANKIVESRPFVTEVGKTLVDKIIESVRSKVIVRVSDDISDDIFMQELERWGVIEGKNNCEYYPRLKRLKELKQTKYKKEEEKLNTALNILGINIKSLNNAVYVYVPHPKKIGGGIRLDPYLIGEQFFCDLLETAPVYAQNSRQKDVVAIALEIIVNKSLPSENEFMQALCRDNKIFFSDRLAEIKKRGGGSLPSRDFNVYDSGRIIDFLNGESDAYLLYRDTVVNELIRILESAGKGHERVYHNFRIVWKRFNPREFDLPVHFSKKDLHSSYRFSLTSDAKKLGRAIELSGSCLSEREAKTIVDEVGTLNLIISYGSKSAGYARLFMAETDKNESALLIDTIEVNHKDFDRAIDTIKATCLAVIQLGLDMNVKYVLGDEGRVKYIKQGFGNKQVKTKLIKLGSNPSAGCGFHVSANSFDRAECYVLMRNWRV